jgi:hypothetical protein
MSWRNKRDATDEVPDGGGRIGWEVSPNLRGKSRQLDASTSLS